MTNREPKEWYSTAETARQLNRNIQTVQAWVREGRINGVRQEGVRGRPLQIHASEVARAALFPRRTLLIQTPEAELRRAKYHARVAQGAAKRAQLTVHGDPVDPEAGWKPFKHTNTG